MLGVACEWRGGKLSLGNTDGSNLPEADLLDPMLLPDLQRVVLETREQVWHPAWEGGVDSELVDHLDGGLGGFNKVSLNQRKRKSLRSRDELSLC